MRAYAAVMMIVGLFASSTAFAQERDPQVDAVDAMQRANELAGKGKFADAIGYYEKAIKLDGANNELAYYNLGEVQKARGNCRAAVLMFQLYASVVGTPNARKEIETAMKGCKTEGWPTLQLKVEPAGDIFIDDMFAGASGSFGPVVVPPGSYEVRFDAADHHPEQKTIEVGAEPVTVTETLKKMTFFGTITVKASVPGARIRVFKGDSDDTEVLWKGKSPMKEGVKAREGRHFVEVTKDGFKRWIRNVSVGRDTDTEVDVELRRELPDEIR